MSDMDNSAAAEIAVEDCFLVDTRNMTSDEIAEIAPDTAPDAGQGSSPEDRLRDAGATGNRDGADEIARIAMVDERMREEAEQHAEFLARLDSVGEVVHMKTLKSGEEVFSPSDVNVRNIVRYHPILDGVFAYNHFEQDYICKRLPYFMTNKLQKNDPMANKFIHEIKIWIMKTYTGIHSTVYDNTIKSALQMRADNETVDTMRDFFEALPEWDGVPRAETMLRDYFGVHDNDLTREYSKRFLIAATARAIKPGCKVDNMLILEGGQGSYKTSGLIALFYGEERDGTSLVVGNLSGSDKNTIERMRGKWLGIFDEFQEHASNRESKGINAFMTSEIDTYRPPWATRAMDFPRRSIYAATTNDSEYLRGVGGERRYWPVSVSKADVEAIRRDRDQIWAEAFHLFNMGEAWHLSEEMEARSISASQQRIEQGPEVDAVAEFLEKNSTKHLEDGVTIPEVMEYMGATAHMRFLNEDFNKKIRAALGEFGFKATHNKRGSKAGGKDNRQRVWRCDLFDPKALNWLDADFVERMQKEIEDWNAKSEVEKTKANIDDIFGAAD